MKKFTSLLIVAALAGIFAVGCTKPEEGDPSAKTGGEPPKTETPINAASEPGKDAAGAEAKTDAPKTDDGHEHKEGDGHDHSKDGK